MSGFSNVLLIEDNPGDRRLVVEYLRERYGDDCTVREASTLAAGLASLRDDGTDVVLLDLGLPDSVGLDSYFAVSNAAPTTPVVILTGDDDEDAAAQALHEGAEDYLAKRHADSVALIRAMRHAVHRRKAGARAAAFDPRCKALTEIVDDGIAQVDAQGVISFANAQLARLLLGRQDEPEAAARPEALIGCRLADHVLPADHPTLAELLAVRSGQRLAAELRLRRPGAEAIAVAAAAGAIERDDGSAPEVLLLLTDVSKRQQAVAELDGYAASLEARVAERTEQLRAENADLEALSYSMAHDLRTPLNGILGFAAMMRLDGQHALSEPQAQRLRVIERSAHGMDDLIGSLLQLARLGRQEIRHEPLDLSAIAQAAVDMLEVAEPRRQVQWHIEPGLRAEGDPTLVATLLQNLIGNAWKYSARQPEARIRVAAVHAAGGAAGAGVAPAFEVRDNGVGFDMALVGRLFEPFERLPSAKGFAGSGIGLATARRIVERHGGRIWAESQPGQGARFCFTLGAPATGHAAQE